LHGDRREPFRGRSVRIVAERAGGIERIGEHLRGPAVASRIVGFLAGERAQAEVVESRRRRTKARCGTGGSRPCRRTARDPRAHRRGARRGARVAGGECGGEAVERGRSARQTPLVGGERLARVGEGAIDRGRVRGRAEGAEHALVGRCELGLAAQMSNDGRAIAAHLDRALDRLERLAPQRVGASVPEEPALTRDVEQARRVARAARDALRDGLSRR
jgi:hypothetical protein